MGSKSCSKPYNKRHSMLQSKPHSIPVPRIYKAAAIILNKVKKGEELRDLVFSCKHRNVKGIYALVCNTIKNDSLLEFIFEKTGMSNEVSNPELAKILVTELLWGKKILPGESKPVKLVNDYKSKLESAVEESDIPITLEEKEGMKPRYVRVNTLLVTVKGTIQRFVDEGWELIDTPDSYEHFLEQISNLNEGQFVQDFHFDDVLVFPTKTDLLDDKLVENGSLILQDKASCLPPRLLNPDPGSVVLDMCAAPGMKTSHLANIMKNKGTIYAVDMNQDRFELMQSKIENHCLKHNCVKPMLMDAVHLTSETCPGVQYILVDPTCSGTGMSRRMEDLNDLEKGIHTSRLQKLSNFQERLLVQALTAFPDVERVVYSTCSTLQEENENVLERVLARVPWFQVVAPNLEKTWKHRGNSQYPFGSNCLVAGIEKDYTNGFFVAVLERIPGMGPTKEKSLKRKSDVTQECDETSDGWEFPKKRKQAKRKKNKMNTNQNELEENVNVDT